MGVTGSQLDNLSQLAENQSNQILEENTLATETTSTEFPSLLPTAMKIAAKTISNDLIFAPTGQLFYLDFKYEKNYKKTRRAGKKHKKKNEQ
jgi:hypothetical protein